MFVNLSQILYVVMAMATLFPNGYSVADTFRFESTLMRLMAVDRDAV